MNEASNCCRCPLFAWFQHDRQAEIDSCPGLITSALAVLSGNLSAFGSDTLNKPDDLVG